MAHAKLGRRSALLAAVAVALPGCAYVNTESQNVGATKWELVKFVGPGNMIVTPEEEGIYRVTINGDFTLIARIGCNYGRGTWRSDRIGRIEFSPFAMTRATCPPGSMHDQIVRQWPDVRTYLIRDRRLYLSLRGNEGTYEFEPM